MMPSFVEFLVENGYTYSESMQYCTMVMYDIAPEDIDFLYWQWSNKYIEPKCMKGEK